MVDFVEICNIYVRKMIIKAAKRIFNSDKICRSYSDLNFGVTFFGTQCRTMKHDTTGSSEYTTASIILGGSGIQDKTRSARDKLDRHSQERPTKTGTPRKRQRQWASTDKNGIGL